MTSGSRRSGNGFQSTMRGAHRIALFHRPPGGLGDVGDEHVGMSLARAPGLEAPGDAPCNQRPAGFELGIPSLFDQDGVFEEDPVVLPETTADARGLDGNAGVFAAISASPISVAGRRGGKRNATTRIER
jgi:hypothetical protein